jgi:uncharacterized membrane protein
MQSEKEKQTNEVWIEINNLIYLCLACGIIAIAFFETFIVLGISASFDEQNRLLPAMAGLAFGISIGLQITKKNLKSLIVN